jgi:NitT/TauT family transport system substrate-binding protein
MKSLICGVFTLLLCMSSVHASTQAKLIIDTGPFGVHSWFLKGIKDGAFSKRGLDIEFVGKGPGSVKTGLALATGRADIGYHDYSGVVLVNSKSIDPKILAILVVDDKAQNGVITLKSSGIKTFDDLNGRKLGSHPTSFTNKVLTTVTSARWINVPIHMSGRVPALVSGHIDAIASFTTSVIANLEKAGVGVDELNIIKLSDHFPMAVSRVITVNADWAEKNPQAVKVLREVSRQLLNDFIKNPAASVSALEGPIVSTSKKVDIEVRRAQYGIDELVNTPFVQKNGISNASAVGPRLSEFTTLLVEKLNLPIRHPDNKYFDLGE